MQGAPLEGKSAIGKGMRMNALGADEIEAAMAALAAADPAFARMHAQYGSPAPRMHARGYTSLLRTIVSQQVSTAAAATIWRRLMALVGEDGAPEAILAASPQELRAAGLSGRKVEYVRDLAIHVLDGRLPLDNLPDDDEAAIALLSAVRGLGRWSAEIYLLFAEGRRDVFPAGDLAIRIATAQMFDLADPRPTERAVRALAEGWRPHRGTAALFLWHCYNSQPL